MKSVNAAQFLNITPVSLLSACFDLWFCNTNNIIDIHKYLMRNNIIKNHIILGFIFKIFIGLLGVCTIKGFSGLLPSNYKELIKCL